MNRTPDEADHDALRALVAPYAAAEAAPADAARVEAHLLDCAACRTLFDATAATLAALWRADPARTAPAPAPRRGRPVLWRAAAALLLFSAGVAADRLFAPRDAAPDAGPTAARSDAEGERRRRARDAYGSSDSTLAASLRAWAALER